MPPGGLPFGPGGLDAFLRAGQQLAAQMQAANPDLVDTLRRQMQGRDPNNPDAGDEGGEGGGGGPTGHYS